MKVYPLKGRGVVMITGVMIIFIGMGMLIPGLSPSSSEDETSELKLDEGGFTIHEIQDVVYGTSFSFSIYFWQNHIGERKVSLHLLDEEDHEDLMTWMEEENGMNDTSSLLTELDSLDVLHTERFTEYHEFDVTVEYEGDVYLLILNEGDEQALEVTWESSQGYPLGVCSIVFLILGAIGVLVFMASRDIIE